MNYIVMDIDGVLADNDHRLHHILNEDGSRRSHPDWKSFYRESEKDEVIPEGKLLLVALCQARIQDGFRMAFLSGRSESYRCLTVEWLWDKGIAYASAQTNPLFLRPDGDHRPDYVFKGQILERLRQAGNEIVLIVDDSQAVVDEAVRLGFTALHFRRPGEARRQAMGQAHNERVGVQS